MPVLLITIPQYSVMHIIDVKITVMQNTPVSDDRKMMIMTIIKAHMLYLNLLLTI